MILLSARFFRKKRHLLTSLTKKLSTKNICNNSYISTTFVSLMAKFDNEFNVDFFNLPEHLSFDEFNSTKYANGTMNFIYLNSGNHKVLDIVENRQLNSQKNYFLCYHRYIGDKVKTVYIAMYSP